MAVPVGAPTPPWIDNLSAEALSFAHLLPETLAVCQLPSTRPFDNVICLLLGGQMTRSNAGRAIFNSIPFGIVFEALWDSR